MLYTVLWLQGSSLSIHSALWPTEFGNDSKDVLEDVRHVRNEDLLQIAHVKNAKKAELLISLMAFLLDKAPVSRLEADYGNSKQGGKDEAGHLRVYTL